MTLQGHWLNTNVNINVYLLFPVKIKKLQFTKDLDIITGKKKRKQDEYLDLRESKRTGFPASLLAIPLRFWFKLNKLRITIYALLR